MGCGGFKGKLSQKQLKQKHREMFEKLNFSEIQPKDLHLYDEKKLTYHQKYNGYRLLISDTIYHLNVAWQGSFVDQVYKKKMIVRLVYSFFSIHHQKDIQEEKKCFLMDYLTHNKNLILYFWYSVMSYPRVLTYLLVQSLVGPLLPNEDRDLEFFYGGLTIDGFMGTHSPAYVGKKVKEIYPQSNLHLTEKIIRDYILKEEDNEYIQEMIILEKQEEQKPKEMRQFLKIKDSLIVALFERMIVFFHPYILFDIYTGNENSLKQMSELMKVDLIQVKDDYLKEEEENRKKKEEEERLKKEEEERLLAEEEEKRKKEDGEDDGLFFNKEDQELVDFDTEKNVEALHMKYGNKNNPLKEGEDDNEGDLDSNGNKKEKKDFVLDIFAYERPKREVLKAKDVVDSSSESEREEKKKRLIRKKERNRKEKSQDQ